MAQTVAQFAMGSSLQAAWLAPVHTNLCREIIATLRSGRSTLARPHPPHHRCLVLARAASSSSGKAKQLYVCSSCGEQTAQWCAPGGMPVAAVAA